MAPRLIARSIRFPSQVGSVGTRKGTGDRGDLARITEPVLASVFRSFSCHSSWVKGALPVDADRLRSAAIGGRLAQLVRALP